MDFFPSRGHPLARRAAMLVFTPGGQSKKFNHQFVGRGCLIAISSSASHSGLYSFFPSFPFPFFPLPWWHHDGYNPVEGPASAGR